MRKVLRRGALDLGMVKEELRYLLKSFFTLDNIEVLLLNIALYGLKSFAHTIADDVAESGFMRFGFDIPIRIYLLGL